MSLAVYFSWQIVLTCKPAVLHTSPHDGTVWVSSPHIIFQHCKHFKTLWGFYAKYITHYAFTALLINKNKNKYLWRWNAQSRLGWFILKSISPPTGQPHATLPFTCQGLTRSWQAPPGGTFCHIWHSLPINNLHAKRKSLYEWLRRWVSLRPLTATKSIRSQSWPAK